MHIYTVEILAVGEKCMLRPLHDEAPVYSLLVDIYLTPVNLDRKFRISISSEM